MGYRIYLGKLMLPVTPEEISTSRAGREKTSYLVSGGEYINIKGSEPREIKFTFLLPNRMYPFANYKIDKRTGEKDFIPASFFKMYIDTAMNNKSPLVLRIEREDQNGKVIYYDKIKVYVASFDVSESAENGIDYVGSIVLKEIRDFASIIVEEQNEVTKKTEVRETDNAPKPTSAQTYTVVKNDTLFGIAHKFYGDGNKYPVIYEANRDKISNPNNIYIGQVLAIPTI